LILSGVWPLCPEMKRKSVPFSIHLAGSRRMFRAPDKTTRYSRYYVPALS
jgi:hypothetical protein